MTYIGFDHQPCVQSRVVASTRDLLLPRLTTLASGEREANGKVDRKGKSAFATTQLKIEMI